MAIELNGIGNNLNPRVRGGDQGSAKEDSAAVSNKAEAPASAGDRVQLSSHAQSLYMAEGDDSIDSNKVAALRQEIEEGSYSIDYQKLAGKLMDLESKL
ncbi:flagellar biosynthesis anti-sigma factor FlgM [Marinospirillum sp.]|uniref:flagellar biosynthesis anti-sigma factor FlgM n=1 Tax=Marinospirillum sp. TaxID=2183934 RepID=UPI0028702857|nr:flagellar biosynthesis anti-sigma factor FlgM [Marinospirillum sp.]MDR9467727.1 flagellar biosynthesis anti-sigma factor FlgM [Marinospirillum sp.]